jgi:hypothetical protein
MLARIFLTLLFCFGLQARAQYIVYEPGSWQELQLIITQDGGNSLRFNPRVWNANTDTTQSSRGVAFRPYFRVDNPESENRLQDVNEKGKSTFIINPVLNLQAGSGFDGAFNQNGRGVEVRGNIQQRVAFYTQVVENQTYFPQFVNRYRDSLGVVPGLGWWKGAGQNGGVAARQTDYLQ